VPPAGPPPLIGLSTYRLTASWSAWEAEDAALVPGSYLDMVERAGGQPVLIPPSGPEGRDSVDGRRVLMDHLDGLVLIGGGDIVARHYGQVADPHNGGENDHRDGLELGLLAGALGSGLPVLAVCRGLQLLNVYCGGDLVQHVPDRSGSVAHLPRPGAYGPITVTTEPGSLVRRLYGEQAEVLCSHHQAVDRLGAGLVVTAHSGDGVIEAVELAGHPFVVGVQWHPEASGDTRLFEALVGAVRTSVTTEAAGG
jgi:gamma-glutamyl-gamma-aminobutyrate hydrolase PuuD